MSKAEIRKDRLAARRAMSLEGVAAHSRAVIDRLRSLEAFHAARAFLCYVSSKDNEVDTLGLIQSLLDNHKPVIVPIAEPGGKMTWSRIIDLGELTPSHFGILEPRPEFHRVSMTPPDSVAIVPGIAWSIQCHRIGYGGGYFDRFLAAYKGATIGLAFDLQIVELWDIQPHDIPLNYVVTESRVYRNDLGR